MIYFFFFFNDTATTEIYTLSLHDALPISASPRVVSANRYCWLLTASNDTRTGPMMGSEEHTSELQSPCNLVCRLLLEKKKKQNKKQMLDTYEKLTQEHRESRYLCIKVS